MPAFGAAQTPTALAAGDQKAILNAENLANGALSMAIAVDSQPIRVALGIVNASGQSITLVASADNKADGSTYYPVYNDAGTAITVPNGQAWMVDVASGLYYAVKAGGAINAGTVWMAR